MSSDTMTREDGTEFWNKLWDVGRTLWHDQHVNR